jgi:hypothetical protein
MVTPAAPNILRSSTNHIRRISKAFIFRRGCGRRCTLFFKHALLGIVSSPIKRPLCLKNFVKTFYSPTRRQLRMQNERLSSQYVTFDVGFLVLVVGCQRTLKVMSTQLRLLRLLSELKSPKTIQSLQFLIHYHVFRHICERHI